MNNIQKLNLLIALRSWIMFTLQYRDWEGADTIRGRLRAGNMTFSMMESTSLMWRGCKWATCGCQRAHITPLRTAQSQLTLTTLSNSSSLYLELLLLSEARESHSINPDHAERTTANCCEKWGKLAIKVEVQLTIIMLINPVVNLVHMSTVVLLKYTAEVNEVLWVPACSRGKYKRGTGEEHLKGKGKRATATDMCDRAELKWLAIFHRLKCLYIHIPMLPQSCIGTFICEADTGYTDCLQTSECHLHNFRSVIYIDRSDYKLIPIFRRRDDHWTTVGWLTLNLSDMHMTWHDWSFLLSMRLYRIPRLSTLPI